MFGSVLSGGCAMWLLVPLTALAALGVLGLAVWLYVLLCEVVVRLKRLRARH
jgi:hypothetical protein